MADTKFSGLTAVASVVGSHEFYVNESGTSKKANATQMATYIGPFDASDTVQGKIQLAAQADQETATSTTLAVTPSIVQNHPSAAKFWLSGNGTSTTMEASYNMTSWAHTATGDSDGTIATDFSSTSWCGVVSIMDSTGAYTAANITSQGFDARAAGTFGVRCVLMTEGNVTAYANNDPDWWFVAGFGDQ